MCGRVAGCVCYARVRVRVCRVLCWYCYVLFMLRLTGIFKSCIALCRVSVAEWQDVG